MSRSEREDSVWPDLAPHARLSWLGASSRGARRRRSALCWGISSAIHGLLLVAIGVLTQQSIQVPQPQPIRVSVLPTIGTVIQALPAEVATAVLPARLPERYPADAKMLEVPLSDPDPVLSVTSPLPVRAEPIRDMAPATPERPRLELLEIRPEATMEQQPTPPIQPRRDLTLDPPPPDAQRPMASTISPAPVAAVPASLVPRSVPARELPKRGRPPTTFEDAVVARLPPAAQGQREVPSPATPKLQEQKAPPQPSVPRSSGVRYGQHPTPPYPPEARRRGWEGTVLLLVEILESGRPERVTIKQSSGYPLLDEAALGAVDRWTFIPAQREGKPVKSVAEVPIVFALRKD